MLAAVVLTAVFAFVAFAVDTGLIAVTQTEMQNAVDAASLAASQEITGAVYEAGQGQGSATIDANSIAVANARVMAATVASLNGVYVDPNQDVEFGKRTFDDATSTWPIVWGAEPYNVVRVTARRTDVDTSRPDGQVKLSFGWAVNKPSVDVTASAAAFVEARDIVLVLDFSASMNDDSSIRSFGSLGQSGVEASLDNMWDTLILANPQWPGTSTSKFPSSGFGEINSDYGTYVSSSDSYTILNSLRLHETVGGQAKYPFPQAGRDSSGLPKNKPSSSTSENRWYGYINYVKNKSGTYRKRYGYRTLMDYLQERRYLSNRSEDLWRTSHYPFHAIKEGASLFLDFLTNLDFGDEIGLVSYGGYSQVELVLD
ncbi:MAG: pilus assembly protein TadG-related protein, partial [Pirellulales bacterium]